jgi:hypothetical protein
VSASPTLVTELKAQVLRLEDDLRARVQSQPGVLQRWQDEHRAATRADRTASSWVEWRDDRVTQAAVAWVLATVFIRFSEDNRLLSRVWISGPPERRQEAMDAQNAYFRAHPTDTDREWLGQAIDHLRATPATRSLVEDHSPLWTVSPSGAAVTALLSFWRERGDDGALLRDLAAADLSTRFLGDLYQDLSEHAKKTYALLQTPEFVEEFILDQTMEPALAERPLDGFRLIDPACGSGHFLLGAFARLLRRWDRHAPTMEPRERVQRCLDAVAGVDLNPFAVAITRFRLTLAALQALGETSLERAPGFTYSVLAGDSLLFGHSQAELGFGDTVEVGGFAYSSEDRDALDALLAPGQYDVVVGNPPYITVKDATLNQAYRALYSTCKGKYALTAPFMELFYRLAKRADSDKPAGWTGQITSNSFMKREFGSKLIEDFLASKDLVRVIDTAGAYIPGHGTPTVILVGRNQRPQGTIVRAVLGIQGEPGRPEVAAEGLVWRAIVDHIEFSGHEDHWVSVADLPRATLAHHPWSLSGGGAEGLSAAIEAATSKSLATSAESVGITSFTLEDEVFIADPSALRTRGIATHLRTMVLGDGLRDWQNSGQPFAIFPYDSEFKPINVEGSINLHRWMWPYRTNLSNNVMFGGVTKVQSGCVWSEYGRLTSSKLRVPQSIAFAFVATHNHFVLDRGGKVFNRSAPVIKLPEGASEDEHLALLGVLNSSTACFWLKQNSYPKGGDPIGTDGARVSQQPWSDRYEFTGTTLQDFPLPSRLRLQRGRLLDGLAQRLAAHAPEAVTTREVPTATGLHAACVTSESLRGEMIAQQEELDWEVYRLYGIVDDDLTYAGNDLPQLALGERAFEIALARRTAAGEAETSWFRRHGSTPITELPAHWTPAYRHLVERRLELIASDRFVGLLERPEYKRRWASEPWEKQREAALRGWLLDRLEDRAYWFDRNGRPTPQSVSQLADRVARDSDLAGVLALWEGRPDVPIVQSLSRLLADEAVPYLAAQRLKDSGLRKREAWEHTWALQRREDAGEKVGPVPVPPKYTSADFRKASYWQARGKLDVPKERFIAYPGAGRATDPTLLLGWAGWHHAEQALALAMILAARESEGADDEALVPLVAGLAELQPWVEQWHAAVNEAYGMSLAEFCREELATRARQVNRSLEQLRDWRPAPAARGRRARA